MYLVVAFNTNFQRKDEFFEILLVTSLSENETCERLKENTENLLNVLFKRHVNLD